MTGFTDLEDWYAAPLGRRYRERLWQAIAPVLAPLPERRILDAGCGAGHYSILLADAGARVTGIDPNDSLVVQARRRVPTARFAIASVTDLPFPDASFEAVLCTNVLEFVPDPTGALTELRRVACGRSVLVVLARNTLWHLVQRLGRRFTRHPYYRGEFFDLARLRQVVTGSGWQLATVEPVVELPPVSWQPLLDWSEGKIANACWLAILEPGRQR